MKCNTRNLAKTRRSKHRRQTTNNYSTTSFMMIIPYLQHPSLELTKLPRRCLRTEHGSAVKLCNARWMVQLIPCGPYRMQLVQNWAMNICRSGSGIVSIWIRNRVDLDQESCSELIQIMDLAGEGVAAGVHRERKRYLSEPGVPIPKRTLLRYRQHRLKAEVDPESG